VPFTGNLTVLLRLLMLTPIAAPSDQWQGIGFSALDVEAGLAVTPLDVTSVYAINLINASAVVNGTAQRLRRVEVVNGQWRDGVYGDKFMFTYTSAGEVCGCDLGAGTSCDACGTMHPLIVAHVHELVQHS
jgi:hypothetical protein